MFKLISTRIRLFNLRRKMQRELDRMVEVMLIQHASADTHPGTAGLASIIRRREALENLAKYLLDDNPRLWALFGDEQFKGFVPGPRRAANEVATSIKRVQRLAVSWDLERIAITV